MRVRAEISSLDELSGHADQRELLAWLKPQAAHLRQVFLVHGEPAQQEALARLIRSEYRLNVADSACRDSRLSFPKALTRLLKRRGLARQSIMIGSNYC